MQLRICIYGISKKKHHLTFLCTKNSSFAILSPFIFSSVYHEALLHVLVQWTINQIRCKANFTASTISSNHRDMTDLRETIKMIKRDKYITAFTLARPECYSCFDERQDFIENTFILANGICSGARLTTYHQVSFPLFIMSSIGNSAAFM